jgi:hypothetical protein
MSDAAVISILCLTAIVFFGVLIVFGKQPKSWKAKRSFEIYSAFPTEIVGESHYQDVLLGICGRKTLNGHRKIVDAEMLPEPDNRYDPNAVAVYIDRHVVGYLSREDAKTYHAIRGSTTAACKALIVGGWKQKVDEDEWDEGSFGVRLAVRVDQKKAV